MKKQQLIKLCCVLIFSSKFSLCLSDCSPELIEMGKQVYIYAYPLVLGDITKRVTTNSYSQKNHNVMKPQAPINQFAHVPFLREATFNYIVRPNIDTLYSSAWLDLEKEPIILTVPDTCGRYYVLEIMDAWTNVFSSVGKRTTGTKKQHFIIVGPSWKGDIPQGMHKIVAPTNIVWILGRTLTNGKTDYAQAQKIQNKYQLTLLSQWQKKSIQRHTTLFDSIIDITTPPVDQVAAMDAKTFYSTFAEALKKIYHSLMMSKW